MPIPAGATIVVSYKAELNENAQIGNPGNPNMSHIVFSNNPYVPTSHGETPDDKTVVYTFQFDVNKIDDHGNPLADAQFALYKLVPNDSKDPAYTEEQLKNLPESQKDTHHWVFVDDLENVTVENIVDHTKFFIKGLDDGTYRLVETEVPAGYNAAEDLIFTLTDDGHSLEDLGTLTVTPPVTVVDEDDVTGEIETDVINRQGITLPETGGIGTTIFYVVGGALVLAAIVLLITKKRMSKVD